MKTEDKKVKEFESWLDKYEDEINIGIVAFVFTVGIVLSILNKFGNK